MSSMAHAIYPLEEHASFCRTRSKAPKTCRCFFLAAPKVIEVNSDKKVFSSHFYESSLYEICRRKDNIS